MGRQLAGAGLGGITRVGAVAFGCRRAGPLLGIVVSKDQYSPRVVEEGEPVPKGGGTYRVGKPYNINGRTYVPAENPTYRAEGIASWYGRDFHGRLTANGEVYDMHSISAAHTTLPLPSYVRVTNLDNGRSIIVRVNDRGPYTATASSTSRSEPPRRSTFYSRGLARVRVEYVGRAPIEGSDDAMLMATLREGSPAPAPSKVMIAAAKPFVPNADDGKDPPTPGASSSRSSSASTRAAAMPPAESPRPVPAIGQEAGRSCDPSCRLGGEASATERRHRAPPRQPALRQRGA